MTLNGVGIHRNHLAQSVESNISAGSVSIENSRQWLTCQIDEPNVIVPVAEELAQDIDRHHPQTAVCFDLEDSHDSLVQNGIPNILR